MVLYIKYGKQSNLEIKFLFPWQKREISTVAKNILNCEKETKL